MLRTMAATNNSNNGAQSSSGSNGSPPGPGRRIRQLSSSSKSQQQQIPQLVPTSPSPIPIRPRVRIVPEIYNDYNQIGLRQALSELDIALDENCSVIVIEPMNLGDQTSRWIRIGNGLHKTAVLCGSVSSIGFWIGDPWPNGAARNLWYCICGSLAFASLMAHVTHVLSWQADPCSFYQVETDPRKLARLLADANYYTGGGNGNGNTVSTSGIQAASVVVLVKKDLRGRRCLQNSVAALTAAAVLYRLYKGWA